MTAPSPCACGHPPDMHRGFGRQFACDQVGCNCTSFVAPAPPDRCAKCRFPSADLIHAPEFIVMETERGLRVTGHAFVAPKQPPANYGRTDVSPDPKDLPPASERMLDEEFERWTVLCYRNGLDTFVAEARRARESEANLREAYEATRAAEIQLRADLAREKERADLTAADRDLFKQIAVDVKTERNALAARVERYEKALREITHVYCFGGDGTHQRIAAAALRSDSDSRSIAKEADNAR